MPHLNAAAPQASSSASARQERRVAWRREKVHAARRPSMQLSRGIGPRREHPTRPGEAQWRWPLSVSRGRNARPRRQPVSGKGVASYIRRT
eukprot:scaffold291993_cov24-Tisochrysis_lutea.AAC.3